MIARRLAPAFALAALTLAVPASASAVAPDYLAIEDGVSLGPSDPLPDSVFFAPAFGDFYGGVTPVTSIERDGVVIAANDVSFYPLSLPELRDGDVIVSRDARRSNRPIILTFTYRKTLHLDEPVCAGQTQYAGSRTPGSYGVYGSTANWAAGEDPYTSNWPGSYPGYPYPGGAGGWYPTEARLANVKPVGTDRFSFDAKRPTTAGMQVALAETYISGNFTVDQRVEQVVKDCPAPVATTPPVVTPPAPPATTAPPARDTKAPIVTLSGLKASTLKKLGLTKLLKKGLPVTLTLDEAGKVTAKITLVKGKKKSKLGTTTKSVVKGKNALTFSFSKSAKKKVKAAKKTGKLLVELTVTDAAGNTKVLPPVTVKIPK